MARPSKLQYTVVAAVTSLGHHLLWDNQVLLGKAAQLFNFTYNPLLLFYTCLCHLFRLPVQQGCKSLQPVCHSCRRTGLCPDVQAPGLLLPYSGQQHFPMNHTRLSIHFAISAKPHPFNSSTRILPLSIVVQHIGVTTHILPPALGSSSICNSPCGCQPK